MQIVITGAFGFVGTNLSKALYFKHQLIAIDLIEDEDHCYSEFFSWNNIAQINWEKIDAVIHLAGKAHDTKNTTDEQVYMDINVGLTKNIFEHFLNSNASRFIYFSSVKAMADMVMDNCMLTEEMSANPKSVYGKSKLEAEKYLTARLNEFTNRRKDNCPTTRRDDNKTARIGKEKQLFILRPTMIHGPGNKGNLNLLYNLVAKGIPWPLGAFDNKRSSTSINNLQFIITSLIEKEVVSGTYIIADDQSLSTNRIIEIIAESKAKKARIWKIKPKLIYNLASIGDKLHLPLNSERLKKLTESYLVSNTKIKNAIEVDKLPTNADDGMKQTINSFNKNK